MPEAMSQGWCFKSGGRCTETIHYKPNQVFAAFPFQDDYYWLFDEIVKPTIEGLRGKNGRYNLKVVDARTQTKTRDFMCSIVEGIRSSRFFIADLSLWRPDVYLELGIAIGLGLTGRRPFVLISNFAERLSADISSVNVVSYDWRNLDAFKARLDAICLETFKAAAPAPIAAYTPSALPVGDSNWLLPASGHIPGFGYPIDEVS